MNMKGFGNLSANGEKEGVILINPYRQVAHQRWSLFLFWLELPGSDEFLPDGTTLFVFCLVVLMLFVWESIWFPKLMCVASIEYLVGLKSIEIWEKGVEICRRYEEAWFMQALIPRLAASKAPPGDSKARGCSMKFSDTAILGSEDVVP
ncbi:hypothetical protein DEO72_LG1g2817 [Vigna unguiculata]|uniref:Uncharacterized protein n=1 Tax=Vigna unguiculata TaxID=3917 RepID=A0A4D6KND9_VIGUN|nr:hypothetical protein DEO72_LG1g2817 [Vigna unguiculata]